jgi:hypothetical protein
VRATDFFRRGLERIERARERYRVVMLCAEEDPLDCHRGLMIAPALVERGLRPGHLRVDGSVESTEQLEDRLLTATGLDGLFALTEEDRREALEKAYDVMARKKAFRLRADWETRFNRAPIEAPIEAHKKFLADLGIEYQGVREATNQTRVTHCWRCHSHLDNRVDVECAACGWILCPCGACGCVFRAVDKDNRKV